MIAEYLLYEKRVSQIQSWLKNVRDVIVECTVEL